MLPFDLGGDLLDHPRNLSSGEFWQGLFDFRSLNILDIKPLSAD